MNVARWISLVLISAALIVVAKLPPEAGHRFQWFSRRRPPSSELARVRSSLASTRAALAVLTLRDSVLSWRESGSLTEDNGMAVWIDPEIPAEVGNPLVSRVRREWVNQIPDRGFEVIYAVVADRGRFREGPGYWFPSRPHRFYYFPANTDGRTCIVAYLLDQPVWQHYQAGTLKAGRLIPRGASDGQLGLCGFYARFGQPGAQIERWLVSGAHTFGWNGDWTGPPPFARVDHSHGNSLLQESLALSTAACAAGRTAQCLSLMSPSLTDWFLPTFSGQDLLRGAVFSVDLSRLPYGASLLADMVRSLGPERFGRFWTSDASRDEAFAEAAGISLGQWTSRWLSERLAVDPPGPHIPVGQTAVWLLVAAVAVGGRLVRARRRLGG